VFLLRASLTIVISAALIAPSAFASRVHRAPTSGKAQTTAHKSSSKKTRKAPNKRGQQVIEPERVSQIQEALIREHYMSGEVSGKWDATTQAAMQKYQADQGWQTRLMPDSRAIKKLGLGPDYSNAINAPNSSFAPPPPVTTIPPEQAAGFAAAAGVSQQ
jgi:peptidoglycan hydrolase-like protein with peptidoglycan-binding domain